MSSHRHGATPTWSAIDVALRPGRTVLPVEPSLEHAVVVLAGTAAIDDRVVPADQLGYLGSGRDDIAITVTTPARALVVGGEPFEAQPLMWWNFVARDRDEIDAAYEDWQSGSERFGTVDVVDSTWSRRHHRCGGRPDGRFGVADGDVSRRVAAT